MVASTRPSTIAEGSAPPAKSSSDRQSAVSSRSPPGPNMPNHAIVTIHASSGAAAIASRGESLPAVATSQGVETAASSGISGSGRPFRLGSR